ncbi:uncharacterized protein FIBRA_06676 [Fibroporia radiculosa]|uniref:Velvet domain-containing protein n=1 Tax=Fibroporia radiculosa TaxID=599839 RepID=J4IBE0_9APHY|nr:uncharacterized protein FIBRA_06676 [Fibroporia radiculosa]CCM04496.1 predicted protein [Fibroporia radiculosa]
MSATTTPRVRRVGPSSISGPFYFVSGQFAGRTLRAELEELQKADLGRKYARKDRRPLDPPPVVQMRLFEILNAGTPRETETEFDNFEQVDHSILCHADLFPVPGHSCGDEGGGEREGEGVQVQASIGEDEGESSTAVSALTHSASRSRPNAPVDPSSQSPTLPSPPHFPLSVASYASTPSAPVASHGNSLWTYGTFNTLPSFPSGLRYSNSATANGYVSPSLHAGNIPVRAFTSSLSQALSIPAQALPVSTAPLTSSIPTSLSPTSYHFAPIPHPMSTMPRTHPIPNSASMSASSHSTREYTPPLPLRTPGAPSSSLDPSLKSSSPDLHGEPASPADIINSDVVAYVGNYPIRESSKCTQALAGATFVHQCFVIYMLYYIGISHSDLAVKAEGTFLLRYRVFSIFGKARGNSDIPILAECYGGPFRIYSTKEFPGLRASTDLTKHISLFGVRLNLRETERKRRKKCEIEAEKALAVANASSTHSGSPATSASSGSGRDSSRTRRADARRKRRL